MSHKIKNPEKKFIKAIAPKFIPESGECLHIETQERYSFKTTGGHWYSVYRQGKEVDFTPKDRFAKEYSIIVTQESYS